MNADLFNTIKKMIPKLSKGHKLIAKFILENYNKAAFMTAAKLGSVVGVSESTVVRFATEIGFDGYPSLQKAIQDLLKNKLTTLERIEVSTDQLGNSDVLKKVMNLDIQRIRNTLEETSEEQFSQAIDKIAKANTIYIIGSRSSAAIAGFLSYYFNLIFPNVKLIHTASRSELFEQIMRISDRDVLIGISFPRYSKQTVTAFQYASKNNADVIAITDSYSSPLVKYADNVLIAQSDMASFVDSLVAPLSLINALIVALSIKNKENVSDTFEKLEGIWEEYQVYEKNEENIN